MSWGGDGMSWGGEGGGMADGFSVSIIKYPEI